MNRQPLSLLFVLFAGIGIGVLWMDPANPTNTPNNPIAKTTVWTCSMHPQIEQDGPGLCPLCGMDLIPRSEDGGSLSSVTLSAEARKLADIGTVQVMRGRAQGTIRIPGIVAADETRTHVVSAHVAGRIEKLHIHSTEAKVTKGDPLVDLYSPKLMVAQKELITMGDGTSEIHRQAIIDRLLLWGLTRQQIDHIAQEGTVQTTVTLRAPYSGHAHGHHLEAGLYVNQGRALFHIADLDEVWIEGDAFERDLPGLKIGQEADITLPAQPGRSFKATVVWVDHVVDPTKRSSRVRLKVENANGSLHLGQLASAQINIILADDALLIPASAPLLTGTRAIVYIEIETGTYVPREIVLGPRAGQHYVVLEGLEGNERVVTRGAFKIDSALQIQAGDSMMSPDEGSNHEGSSHEGSEGH